MWPISFSCLVHLLAWIHGKVPERDMDGRCCALAKIGSFRMCQDATCVSICDRNCLDDTYVGPWPARGSPSSCSHLAESCLPPESPKSSKIIHLVLILLQIYDSMLIEESYCFSYSDTLYIGPGTAWHWGCWASSPQGLRVGETDLVNAWPRTWDSLAAGHSNYWAKPGPAHFARQWRCSTLQYIIEWEIMIMLLWKR